ncbi:putative transposase/invertase (TIGR01784 family) [Virgibacillus halotolerans]|uniref:Rpn family recombination-promoting nuclease/putative transposase n=1 Tax=Virgibacillus halotolerans TaxID=1071053 RepID=UPI001EF976C0|nr:Rpn family recombination-promoting nuclease/putative transposase [Virgibacillus halotolerans]MBM7601482.1 putative transposase/invertase (TIGR01784 family) [Virgibacillus halotolerans]
MQNPHDKFFKATFSNVEVVKDFIVHFLPPSVRELIDLTYIQPQKDSFIRHDLQEYFSDLLFQTKIHNKPAYVYLLFEHKSYVDYHISLQLLQYMVEIWKTKREKEEIDTLPFIMPIVLYHGQNKWTAASFSDLLKGYKDLPPEMQKYVPDYEYFLYDVSYYQDEEVQLNVLLRIILLMFRDIRKKDVRVVLNSVYRSVDYLQQLTDQKMATEYLDTLFRYVFSANQHLTKMEYYDIIEHVGNTSREGSEMTMSLAEIFRNEGIEEGLQKGKAALANTAIELITKFIAPISEEMKNKLREQEINTLEALIKQIDEFQTIEEVKQYLK